MLCTTGKKKDQIRQERQHSGGQPGACVHLYSQPHAANLLSRSLRKSCNQASMVGIVTTGGLLQYHNGRPLYLTTMVLHNPGNLDAFTRHHTHALFLQVRVPFLALCSRCVCLSFNTALIGSGSAQGVTAAARCSACIGMQRVGAVNDA
jgi:hypothetical protein